MKDPQSRQTRVELASLFPTGDWLARGIRPAYYGFVVSACLLITGGVLLILIETLSSPAIAGWWKAFTSLCAVVVAIHLLRHIRRAGPFARRRHDRASWIAFGLCSGELIVSCWLAIKDPKGRIILTAMVAMGALSAALATLLLGSLGVRLSRARRPVQMLMVVIGWSPVAVIIALFSCSTGAAKRRGATTRTVRATVEIGS